MNIPQQPEGRPILQPRLIQLLIQLHSVPAVNNNKVKLTSPTACEQTAADTDSTLSASSDGPKATASSLRQLWQSYIKCVSHLGTVASTLWASIVRSERRFCCLLRLNCSACKKGLST